MIISDMVFTKLSDSEEKFEQWEQSKERCSKEDQNIIQSFGLQGVYARPYSDIEETLLIAECEL